MGFTGLTSLIMHRHAAFFSDGLRVVDSNHVFLFAVLVISVAAMATGRHVTGAMGYLYSVLAALGNMYVLMNERFIPATSIAGLQCLIRGFRPAISQAAMVAAQGGTSLDVDAEGRSVSVGISVGADGVQRYTSELAGMKKEVMIYFMMTGLCHVFVISWVAFVYIGEPETGIICLFPGMALLLTGIGNYAVAKEQRMWRAEGGVKIATCWPCCGFTVRWSKWPVLLLGVALFSSWVLELTTAALLTAFQVY